MRNLESLRLSLSDAIHPPRGLAAETNRWLPVLRSQDGAVILPGILLYLKANTHGRLFHVISNHSLHNILMLQKQY